MLEDELPAVAALRHLRLLFAHDRRSRAGHLQSQALVDNVAAIARELEFKGVGAGRIATWLALVQGHYGIDGPVRCEVLRNCRRGEGDPEGSCKSRERGMMKIQHFGLGSA